ncbi:MAG: hypothetical protein F6K30_20755 [Cyanothece sp. SIO2G6]|nr:hypothetical protein [Cyanothece sp. SIO2G6]
MTEIDKEIALTYCEKLRLNNVEDHPDGILEFLRDVKTCPITDEIVDCALCISEIHPPDSIRLAAAIAHGLSILTWEPEHFARSSNEIQAIAIQGYTNLYIGSAEKVDSEELMENCSVWILSVPSFSDLFDNFSLVQRRADDDMLGPFSIESYNFLRSSKNSKRVNIDILFFDQELHGTGEGSGPRAAIFNAVKNLIHSVVDLPKYEITFSCCDAWTTISSPNSGMTRAQVGAQVGDDFYKRIEQNEDELMAVAKAYISVVNVIIQDRNISINDRDNLDV